jgi:hypothetical protein
MFYHAKLLGFAVLLAMPAQVQASQWALQAGGGSALVLTYGAGERVSYRFECAPKEVIITETGVTELLDLNSGNKIGDDANAVMPDGAAMMALFSGKGEPKFIPGSAVKNQAGGWDVTIRLPKNDKQLKAMAKSDMMSLFTTGYTMAVAMDSDARAKWNDFILRCNAVG